MTGLRSIAAITGSIRELGPYAVIGLFVPGGSLILLGMWAFQHRAWMAKHLDRVLVIVAAMTAALVLPQGG